MSCFLYRLYVLERKPVKLLKKSLEKFRSVVFEVSSLVGHPVDKIYDLFIKPSHEIKMFPNEQDFAEVDTRHTFSAKCSLLRTNIDNRKSTFVIFFFCFYAVVNHTFTFYIR